MRSMGWSNEQGLIVVMGEGDMVQGWVVFDEWVGNICWLGWILGMIRLTVEGYDMGVREGWCVLKRETVSWNTTWREM